MWTTGHLGSCGRRKESCPSNSDAASIQNGPVSASSSTQRNLNLHVSYGTKYGCWKKTHVHACACVSAHTHTPPEGTFNLSTECLNLVASGPLAASLMKSKESCLFARAANIHKCRKGQNCASKHKWPES